MLDRFRRHQTEVAEDEENGSQSELLSQIEDLKKEMNLLQNGLDETLIIKLKAYKKNQNTAQIIPK